MPMWWACLSSSTIERHKHAVGAITHPLGCASGEEGQHQSEGPNEQAWQCIDDADLLKDFAWIMKGGQKPNMTIADFCRIVHKEVWETIGEAPATRTAGLARSKMS